MADLLDQLGGIDIYLFDQVQKGRMRSGASVLEVGCGSGRNLRYFLQADYEVFAADSNAECIEAVRAMAAELAPGLPAANFRVEPVETHSFPDHSMDIVLCIAVLHFARDEDQFWTMLHGAWRPLRPGGLFFCRLASTTGAERIVRRIEGRRYTLPDGSERFLVDAEMLANATNRLGGVLADPIKTTVVHQQRSMTTWVAWNGGAPPF